MKRENIGISIVKPGTSDEKKEQITLKIINVINITGILAPKFKIKRFHCGKNDYY